MGVSRAEITLDIDCCNFHTKYHITSITLYYVHFFIGGATIALHLRVKKQGLHAHSNNGNVVMKAKNVIMIKDNSEIYFLTFVF